MCVCVCVCECVCVCVMLPSSVLPWSMTHREKKPDLKGSAELDVIH